MLRRIYEGREGGEPVRAMSPSPKILQMYLITMKKKYDPPKIYNKIIENI